MYFEQALAGPVPLFSRRLKPRRTHSCRHQWLVLTDDYLDDLVEAGSNGLSTVGSLAKPHLPLHPWHPISSYDVYEVWRRGVAVPFRKRDAEAIRTISEMRASDKGGMIFQPEPGVYEKVHQIDFTSLYPSIIVKHNLSPEIIDTRRGLDFSQASSHRG